MPGDRLSFLFRQYLEGNATQEELLEFSHLVEDPANAAAINVLMQDGWETFVAGENAFAADESAAMLTAILTEARIGPVRSARIISMRKLWQVAAVVLVLVLAASWYLFTSRSGKTTGPQVIYPAKEAVVLTLANGARVVLDSTESGVVTTQNGSTVRLQQGKLIYEPTGSGQPGIAYNVFATPKGKQASLQLPDGTQVWLNAATIIRFPTTFNGRERRVTVNGEAYFEVAQNTHQPFIVTVENRSEIAVLGTSFNINAYSNEKILRTTLLEGAVRITPAGKQPVILAPGQQAASGEQLIILRPDLDKVMAWKSGMFNFGHMNLQEVMREIERWYDIEVVYEGEVPAISFEGKLPKNISLNELLDVLEEANVSHVHFSLAGRKLVVTKK